MAKEKNPSKMVSVPDYWLGRFQACVEELSRMECYCSDLENEMDSLVECVMTQGKMLEEAGMQPLSPDVLMNMVKDLDARERELSEREKAFKKQFGGMVPRNKKDWN